MNFTDRHLMFDMAKFAGLLFISMMFICTIKSDFINGQFAVAEPHIKRFFRFFGFTTSGYSKYEFIPSDPTSLMPIYDHNVFFQVW